MGSVSPRKSFHELEGRSHPKSFAARHVDTRQGLSLMIACFVGKFRGPHVRDVPERDSKLEEAP